MTDKMLITNLLKLIDYVETHPNLVKGKLIDLAIEVSKRS